MSKLKIWTDFDLEGCNNGFGVVEMLMPFRGQSSYETDPEFNLLIGRYDELEREGARYLELTSLEEAEVAVFPVPYPLGGMSPQLRAAAAAFGDKVKRAGKRTLVFASGEQHVVNVNLPDPIVFHDALYQSQRKPSEFAVTQPIEDLVARYGKDQAMWREKPARPSVGFCGFAPPLKMGWNRAKIKAGTRLLLNYAGWIRRYPTLSAHSYRARALLSLMRQDEIATDFLIRNQFAFAGSRGQLLPGGTPETAETMRAEYVQNLFHNDYNLCVRGTANYSIRLIETLCCGRIPIFVNTDCVLPYDFVINWRKHVVWIEESQIEQIPSIVAEFHQNLGEEEFIDLQKSNRKLWQEFLSPLGFVKNLALCVEQASGKSE